MCVHVRLAECVRAWARARMLAQEREKERKNAHSTMFRHKEIMTFKWYCFSFYGYVFVYILVFCFSAISNINRVSSFVRCLLLLLGLFFFRILCSWLCFDWFLLCLSFGIHAFVLFFFSSLVHWLSHRCCYCRFFFMFLLSFFSFIFHPFFFSKWT